MDNKDEYQQHSQEREKMGIFPNADKSRIDPAEYRASLEQGLPKGWPPKIHMHPNGPGNLEYVIAARNEDLSRSASLSFFATPEERAYQFLNSLKPLLFPGEKENPVKLFLKHTLQSLMGTHCIFGLEYEGFEVEEHAFVVHVDRASRVVMVCCTYLPDLPERLTEAKEQSGKFPEEDKIREQIRDLKEYDRVDAEKLWLTLWDEKSCRFYMAPGAQVKLSLPQRLVQKGKHASVWGITDKTVKPIHNSPGLADQRLGLGYILCDFPEDGDQFLNTMDDSNIQARTRQGVLLDLESTSELRGRYAAIKDEITVYNREMNGIFVGERESLFDRVNAYYHLDYIQRYFREKLGLRLLDSYSHLNPAELVLAMGSDQVALYDANTRRITFYQLSSRKRFTAVRDPRVVYHEFVHAVTDAIARLHRGGRLLTPRASETLQAQAMDEGTADYFACSLAAQQGAQRALFFYRKDKKWTVHRTLDSDPANGAPAPFQVDELEFGATWNEKKYLLGEYWGKYLWRLRKLEGAEIADILVAHSLFFLTRWASFEQGRDALRLADRLLFDARHDVDIVNQYKEVMAGIQFNKVSLPGGKAQS